MLCAHIYVFVFNFSRGCGAGHTKNWKQKHKYVQLTLFNSLKSNMFQNWKYVEAFRVSVWTLRGCGYWEGVDIERAVTFRGCGHWEGYGIERAVDVERVWIMRGLITVLTKYFSHLLKIQSMVKEFVIEFKLTTSSDFSAAFMIFHRLGLGGWVYHITVYKLWIKKCVANKEISVRKVHTSSI